MLLQLFCFVYLNLLQQVLRILCLHHLSSNLFFTILLLIQLDITNYLNIEILISYLLLLVNFIFVIDLLLNILICFSILGFKLLLLLVLKISKIHLTSLILDLHCSLSVKFLLFIKTCNINLSSIVYQLLVVFTFLVIKLYRKILRNINLLRLRNF